MFINLSLNVEPPPTCLMNVWQNWQNPGSEYFTGTQHMFSATQIAACEVDSLFQVQDMGNYLYVPLGIPFADLYRNKYTVVAAAGNDSQGGKTYGANLPAAFCGVKAVAAASAAVGTGWVFGNSAAAAPSLEPYSNAPSIGGQCLQVSPSTGQPEGLIGLLDPGDAAVADGHDICSLYLQPFAAATGTTAANPLGFAEWSGTSFATAYMSGNLASGTIPLALGSSTAPPPALDESQPCTP